MYKSEIRELKRIILQETRRILREDSGGDNQRGKVDNDRAGEIFATSNNFIDDLEKFEEDARDLGLDDPTMINSLKALNAQLFNIRQNATSLATNTDNSGQKVIIGGDKKGKQP
jgi:hypothetical protein